MPKLVAVIMHETPKAVLLLAGLPAVKAWVPKLKLSKPEHLFLARVEYKLRNVVVYDLPAWVNIFPIGLIHESINLRLHN